MAGVNTPASCAQQRSAELGLRPSPPITGSNQIWHRPYGAACGCCFQWRTAGSDGGDAILAVEGAAGTLSPCTRRRPERGSASHGVLSERGTCADVEGRPVHRAAWGSGRSGLMLGESALCVAMDHNRLPDRAGVLTPATGLGIALVDRLRAAGQTLTAERVQAIVGSTS